MIEKICEIVLFTRATPGISLVLHKQEGPWRVESYMPALIEVLKRSRAFMRQEIDIQQILASSAFLPNGMVWKLDYQRSQKPLLIAKL